MATKSKGRIRHFAISVPDPWAAAEFYKNAFGLEELGETDSKLAEGVFLTDGVANLALLKFKDDGAAQGTGKDYVGLHHVGFWVDNAIASGEQATVVGVCRVSTSAASGPARTLKSRRVRCGGNGPFSAEAVRPARHTAHRHRRRT